MNSNALCQTGTEHASACGSQTAERFFQPAVDIIDTNDSVVLVADMPGVDEEHVDVTIEKDVLTIRGTVQRANHEGFDVDHTELRDGDFARSFTISNEIDRDGIDAAVRNGVLRITLPKALHAMSKKVTVKAG